MRAYPIKASIVQEHIKRMAKGRLADARVISCFTQTSSIEVARPLHVEER